MYYCVELKVLLAKGFWFPLCPFGPVIKLKVVTISVSYLSDASAG